MTQTEILQLLNLLSRFDKEELVCDGNCCSTCYYYVEGNLGTQNCPILNAYDMVKDRFNHAERWNR